MFRITQNKGFHITFQNGWTLSVQWGPLNYCANRNDDRVWNRHDIDEIAAEAGSTGSADAEIAAWDAAGKMYDFGNDTVKGWVTPDELVEWINKFSTMPPT
jgi:hypothetical protein